MPIIRIDYDDTKIDKNSMERFSIAIQGIVSKATNIKDVFVYANASQIKINIAPIEVFIELSADISKDLDILNNSIKSLLIAWKKEQGFTTSVNLTIIPMTWKIEIGI